MKSTSLLALALSVTGLTACDGLSQAFTAHADVVAKAGSQELSVDRLADLLGKAKLQIPINNEVTALVARDLWIPYQLLAIAAARGDSLSDPQAIDAAAVGMLENARLQRFMQGVGEKLVVDSGSEADYVTAKTGLYSARHILFRFGENPTPEDKAQLRAKAETVRPQVTSANFADMAKKYSGDGSKDTGGELGVFRAAAMVKPFSDAVASLKPGEISPIVETEFGFHIIQRNTWDKAQTVYMQQASVRGREVAESTYIAQAESAAKVEVKGDAVTTVKEIAKDPMSFRNSKAVLATFQGGALTGGKLALTLLAAPSSAQLMRQIQGAPDSLIKRYVRNMTQREVLLRRADSSKVVMTPEEISGLRRDFVGAVVQSWNAIGIDPTSYGDSAKTPAARERVAAARVERYIDKIMAGEVQPVPIPAPLQVVLMNKYDAKVNSAGVERAVEKALKVRAVADAAKKAAQPQSSVPLPGGVPQMAPAAPPQGAAPPPRP